MLAPYITIATKRNYLISICLLTRVTSIPVNL